MKKLFQGISLAVFAVAAHAADYSVLNNGAVRFIGVSVQTTDYLHFDVPIAGEVTMSIASTKQNNGCQRYQNCGYMLSKVTSAQLQTEDGSPLLDLTSSGYSLPVFSGAPSLPVGNYKIMVTALGLGTGNTPNYGQYTEKVSAPQTPPVPTCDEMYNYYISLGYSPAKAEKKVAKLQAQKPPGCTGD